MELFLAYEDSLKMLRHVRRSEVLMLSDALSCPHAPEPPRDLALMRRALPSQLLSVQAGAPLRLRAWDDANRCQSAALKMTPNLARLPQGSYREVLTLAGDPLFCAGPQVVHVYVESAGLTLLSAARSLERRVQGGRSDRDEATLRLAAFAMELAGSYVRDPTAPSQGGIAYEADAVGSVAGMSSFLEEASQLKGLRLARRALPYASDGSGSAMETLWFLIFCLPPGLGGAHLARPLQNAAVDWPDDVRSISCHGVLTPDFLWPEHRLVAEHDGKDHLSELAFFEDRDRARDYELLGLGYLPLTKRDLRSTEAARSVLRQVAHLFEPYEPPCFERRMRRILEDPEVDAARARLISLLKPTGGLPA